MSLALFLSLIPNAAAAYDPNELYPVFGPQPTDGIYLYYGNETYIKGNVNGDIFLNVDPTSVSYQSILATVTIPNTLIQDRSITRFYIVRNGQRIVDYFDPAWDNWIAPSGGNIVYYPLTISVTDEYIGSVMEFQIVAVTENSSGEEYVVGWSNPSEAVDFKPLPVIDHDAVIALREILAKLEALSEQLQSQLAALQKAVEDIYTPSPEAAAKLDTSVNSFMEKLPMSEMSEQMTELNQTLERSKAALQSPTQEKIELGGRFRLIPELAESEVAFLDVTEYKDFIRTFRTLMEAMLWVFFFQMLMNWLTPKPEI